MFDLVMNRQRSDQRISHSLQRFSAAEGHNQISKAPRREQAEKCWTAKTPEAESVARASARAK
jgi:hypothetical protein